MDLVEQMCGGGFARPSGEEGQTVKGSRDEIDGADPAHDSIMAGAGLVNQLAGPAAVSRSGGEIGRDRRQTTQPSAGRSNRRRPSIASRRLPEYEQHLDHAG